MKSERQRSLSVSAAQQQDIAELTAKLNSAQDKLSCLEPKAELAKQLEKEIADLKDEIKSVKRTNALLADTNEFQSRIIRSRACSPVVCHIPRSCSPVVVHYSRPCSPVVVHCSRPCSPVVVHCSRPASPVCVRNISTSPLSPSHCTQVIRQDSLTNRFYDLYSRNRLNAMDILKNYCDDYENNQRIVFAAVQVI